MHPRLPSAAPAALALLLTLLAALPAAAQMHELPPRKPGLWETRMVVERPAGGLAIVSQMCIDAATDREMLAFGLKASKDNCQRFEMKRAGTGWVIDAECAFGPVRNVTKTTITGDFQSEITFRIEGTTDGVPGAGDGAHPTLMTQTATWKGACAADMKPGDIAIANGLKMNIRQMQKLQKMLPNIQIK